MMSIQERKRLLRAEMRTKRDGITPELRREWSQSICRNVSIQPQFLQARFVHIFCTFGSEPDTTLLMHKAFEQGQRVIVPVTPESGTALLHVEIFPGQEYTLGVFGIPTPHFPDAERYPFCEPAELFTSQDCIIVPLLAFDQQGHRLGYGRGFYDRFLSHTPGVRIGIGFSLQQQEIPADEYDIPMDMIVTEDCTLCPSP